MCRDNELKHLIKIYICDHDSGFLLFVDIIYICQFSWSDCAEGCSSLLWTNSRWRIRGVSATIGPGKLLHYYKIQWTFCTLHIHTSLFVILTIKRGLYFRSSQCLIGFSRQMGGTPDFLSGLMLVWSVIRSCRLWRVSGNWMDLWWCCCWRGHWRTYGLPSNSTGEQQSQTTNWGNVVVD